MLTTDTAASCTRHSGEPASSTSTDGHLEVGSAGSPTGVILRANAEQMRPKLVQNGLLTSIEMDSYLAALDDPQVHWLMPVLFTTRGRHPGKQSTAPEPQPEVHP